MEKVTSKDNYRHAIKSTFRRTITKKNSMQAVRNALHQQNQQYYFCAIHFISNTFLGAAVCTYLTKHVFRDVHLEDR